ncbi:MAG: hypothetical protein R3Y28_00765 [Candidatus Gastranaerophilales bacterium]
MNKIVKYAFNTLGDCLISKKTQQKVTDEIRKEMNLFQGIKFPQRVKEYDVVEIGHSFKPDEIKTKIITFRDEDGNIVQRNFNSNKTGPQMTTQRNYINQEKTFVLDPEDVDGDFLDVTGRKIASVTKQDGVYAYKMEEIQTVATKSDGNKVVNVSHIESLPYGGIDNVEEEFQSMYEYQKGSKRGYAIGHSSRDKVMGIDTIYDMEPEAITFDGVQDLRADRYLPTHLYSLKNFKRYAPSVVQNPKQPTGYISYKWYNKSNTTQHAYFSPSSGSVNLNNRKLSTKTDVVDVVAHEKEHAFQFGEMHWADIARRVQDGEDVYDCFGHKITADRINQSSVDDARAEVFQSALDNYIKPETDLSAYHYNLLEIGARKAGRNAREEYIQSVENIRSEFPYAPSYQLGCSDEEIASESIHLMNNVMQAKRLLDAIDDVLLEDLF